MKLTKAQDQAIVALGFVPEFGTWQVGPHTIVVGDLEAEDVLDELVQYAPWDIAWTDPPWNPALASTFRKEAGYEGRGDLETLFEALADVLGWVRDLALVWTNEELKPRAIGALHQAGFERSCEFKVTYSRFTHATPVSIGLREGVSVDGLDLDRKHGGRAIADGLLDWYRASPGRKAMPATELPDSTVLAVPSSSASPLAISGHTNPSRTTVRLVDPFCGQDVLAHLATDTIHVTGAELHPGRAAVTLARLAKITKMAPVRLS